MPTEGRTVRGPGGRWMRRALALAARGWGQTAPNPLVGAVVVSRGRLVGEGFHARYGSPHAEPVALAAAGTRARGATVYVTLEPCTHHGKTPPCADALIAAGVRHVVVATEDPHALAAGGAARLREAGITVDIGLLRADAEELNAPFLFAARGATRPFVTLKLALSIDGAIAPAGGVRRWLTGPSARREAHRLRAGADAIAVGLGTVLADDPELTVRIGRLPRIPPVRVVFDRDACLPLDTRLVATAQQLPVAVLATQPPPARRDRLARRGVEVVEAPSLDGHLRALRERGIRHLLVEGGAGVAGALLGGGFVDRLVIFQTGIRLGPRALGAFSQTPPEVLATLPDWRLVRRRGFGPDRMSIYAPPGR